MWGIERWREDQLEELWSGRVGHQWGDAILDVLNYTMQIIFLCDHGCKHSFLKVKWLGDMALFVAQGDGEICRSSVVEKASRIGLQLSLAVRALLVHWWYALPITRTALEFAWKGRIGACNYAAFRAVTGRYEEKD